MLTLALDASTYRGTVAIIREGAVIGDAATAMRGETEERLMPAVAALLHAHALSATDLEAVACGSGPGSFTSLRIAASIAKGLAAARSLPLYVTPSPLLIIAGAASLTPGRYMAILDAMRGDVFSLTAVLEPGGRLAVEDGPLLETRSSADARAQSLGATRIGPGEAEPHDPHARGFVALLGANDALVRRVDVATWEPDYGRKAEAQVRWEQAHGRALDVR